MDTNTENIKLKVIKAEQDDRGKQRARIKAEVMEKYGLEEGQIINITGQKKTAVYVHSGDNNLVENEIKIDEIVRENCGAKLGDLVSICKLYDVSNASRVLIETELEDLSLFRDRMNDVLIMLNNYITIPKVLMDQELLKVVEIEPSGSVLIISPNTQVDTKSTYKVKQSKLHEIDTELENQEEDRMKYEILKDNFLSDKEFTYLGHPEFFFEKIIKFKALFYKMFSAHGYMLANYILHGDENSPEFLIFELLEKFNERIIKNYGNLVDYLENNVLYSDFNHETFRALFLICFAKGKEKRELKKILTNSNKETIDHLNNIKRYSKRNRVNEEFRQLLKKALQAFESRAINVEIYTELCSPYPIEFSSIKNLQFEKILKKIKKD